MTTTTPDRTGVPPEHSALLRGARGLVPLLARNAEQGERDRRLPEETVKSLAAAGLFKLAVPRRYGGHEASVRTLADVSAILAEGDGSSAWVVSVCNSVAWVVSLFPEQAQDELFGADPEARISGVLTPSATARKVEGGFRVSGRWHYASGAWHADWALIGFPVPDVTGETVDHGMALLPAADYTVEDTWHVAGMRATGSNCVAAEEVFVPEHRVLSVPKAMAGDYPVQRSGSALARSAFTQFLTGAPLAAPQLGLGRAALDLVRDQAAAKAFTFTFFDKQRDSAAFQLRVAEAAVRIDSAELHLRRAVDDIDAAARGRALDALGRLRARADLSAAIGYVTEAVDTLLTAHGAGGFAEASPLQRIWRDSAVGARHAILQPQMIKEMYGKALLGVEEQISPLV
ncbi:acyl-CoA dehydrogenase [Streptomyces cinereoruber]|uniref:Acyl-CoA dehydrogenase n=1 Tax=Streptomyces cinereoruber TaxID=67260 RepID=A0AAV4KTH7_9ACTN|nr:MULTISPECIES: acyl-CoA dehydrogenase family protein [Streptomyces]AVH94783.1 oxidoreductase [Streptomyces sp. WAC00288]KYG53505.1 oxidoreductase [Streptomyces sp. WAC04657]MBB4157550.1 alkylation response protein AidB-like acyl-CoA dehydrogenase [Streptomyces cinereoruber]MBY8819915.1 acyl-CoA dehydrogenase family protein [Streptomyces cinereoruber]NIH62297.1 alkylation response protein AidB-like acyl-CoA dehydrogenase [Streptomyces cinereoruber]